LSPVRTRYQVLPGKRVFEVMPGGGWGKFEALDLWRSRNGEGLLFFFGDDSIDEPVHRHVRSADGISVAVGRRASKAFYRLSDPGEVVWFLEWLSREWRIAGEA
jgi:trehalose-6-phosphatase